MINERHLLEHYHCTQEHLLFSIFFSEPDVIAVSYHTGEAERNE